MADNRQKELIEMSIITKGRIAKLLQSGWVLPVPVVFIFSINVMIFKDFIDWFQSAVILLLILGVTFSAVLVWWEASQDDIIRFHNVKKALNNGFLVIATNSNSTLREIADNVSHDLTQLKIGHALSGNYAKHLLHDESDSFFQVPLDFIKEKIGSTCKLFLVISAKAVGANGIHAISYDLIDVAGNSVIVDKSDDLPIVYLKLGYSKCKNSSQVAKEIVGSLFNRLNLKIWAATA